MVELTPRQAAAEDIAAWEERAAIAYHDGAMNMEAAEAVATKQLGRRPPWRGSILGVIDACGPEGEGQ